MQGDRSLSQWYILVGVSSLDSAYLACPDEATLLHSKQNIPPAPVFDEFILSQARSA